MSRMEKRQQSKRKRGILFLCALLCIICIGGLAFISTKEKKMEENLDNILEEGSHMPLMPKKLEPTKEVETFTEADLPKEVERPKEQEPIMVMISATGDFTLGNYLPTDETNTFDDVFRKQGRDYGYFLSNVKDIFQSDDLTLVNLEGPLTHATKKMDKPFPFKGDPSYVRILTEGGVEAVNVANNHSHDYFEQGYQDTLKTLEQANIGYYGYGKSYITEQKGIKIGVLGYKTWAKTDAFTQILEKEITHIKEQTDLLIVSFHWGDERTYYPNDIQKYYGHLAIDVGADLVIGRHPHVIQGIEQYKDRYIVYSLGNFCYGGHRNPPDKDTFIFQQTFVFDEQKQCLLHESFINLIPCRISSVPDRNDYRPTPLEGDEKERVRKRIEELSSHF